MINVTYAGAGGGKTTNMVNSIIDNIAVVEPNRFLCVITYTNDATTSIRKKLSEEVQVPPNVFIGTIHSFLFRFIFKPHFPNGSDFSIVSGLVKKEITLQGFIKWANREIAEPEKRKIIIENKWNKRKTAIYEKLQESNLITNDLLVKRSKELVSKASVRKALSNKLQFLFIDEYQDTYKWLHDIFMGIYKGNKTTFYAIGDPNQSIYGFSYGSSENGARRPKEFKDFPLSQLRSSSDHYREIDINYRSSTEIVSLANKFNKSFEQKSYNGSFSPVLAIDTNETSQILKLFHQRRLSLKLVDSVFFLSTDNKSLSPYFDSINNNLDSKSNTCIRTFEKCVSQYIGLSITNTCLDNSISRIQFRSLAITLSKDSELNLNKIKSAFKSKFNSDLIHLEQELAKPIPLLNDDSQNTRALTIHKSKGLEAESVLVLFKSNNHIKKSFSQKHLMECPKDDDLRLIYVAITRAKKLLVIACREMLTEESKKLIKDNDFIFI